MSTQYATYADQVKLRFEHAVIVGSSMAGLMAARILTDYSSFAIGKADQAQSTLTIDQSQHQKPAKFDLFEADLPGYKKHGRARHLGQQGLQDGARVATFFNLLGDPVNQEP
jgi:hypothetical protein